MPLKLTIIGAGPGGYVAAIRAAQMGAQVTVVEDAEVGGTCLNRGCIPTKTLIASAQALTHARSGAQFGLVFSGDVSFNLEKIRERMNKVVSTQVKGIKALFKGNGITLVDGRGSLLSAGLVGVRRTDGTHEEIPSDRIIIATGSRPAKLPGFDFDGKDIMTSDDAVRLDKIPTSLIIIGAGVIGSEFAFIYGTYGSQVTILEMMPRALSTEDPEISSLIEREFKKAKIKLIASVRVERLEKERDGSIRAQLSNGSQINAESVLVSIGRSMNSEGLGLEIAGVAKGARGEISVNEKMQTNVPTVYAIGDVTGKMMLAHVASHQGLIAAENALGGDAKMDYSVIPAGIFTMPEIGSVGLREDQALEKGVRVKIGRFQYRALGKAHAMGEIVGMVKVIADSATDKLLGVHVCGAHASDIVHEGALAMKAGATARELGSMIHAHPTLSEALMEAAEDVHGNAIHVLKSEQ